MHQKAKIRGGSALTSFECTSVAEELSMGDPGESRDIDSELTVVQEAAQLITEGIDLDQSIRRILRLLSHLHGLNRGRVLLSERDDPKLITIRYSYGLSSEKIKKGRYVAGEGVTGYFYKMGKIALVQDIDDEEKYLSRAVSRTPMTGKTSSHGNFV